MNDPTDYPLLVLLTGSVLLLALLLKAGLERLRLPAMVGYLLLARWARSARMVSPPRMRFSGHLLVELRLIDGSGLQCSIYDYELDVVNHRWTIDDSLFNRC